MKTQILLLASIILVSFGLLGVMSMPEPSEEVRIQELFEKYYKLTSEYYGEELPIFEDSRCPDGLEENAPERIVRREAKFMYNMGEYRRASIAMNEILKGWPDNVMFPYYLGRTYLKLNELDSAQIHFENAQKYPNSLHFEEAEWFFALTLLKKQDIAGCKLYLKKTYQKKYSYVSNLAKSLCKELDKDFTNASQKPA